VVTLEESAATGGFGAAVMEAINEAALADPAFRSIPVKQIGIPADRFVDHGSVTDLRRTVRLDEDGIAEQIEDALRQTRAVPSGTSGHFEVRSA
jgi:deoxyxylulose-5-phosphate synthase